MKVRRTALRSPGPGVLLALGLLAGCATSSSAARPGPHAGAHHHGRDPRTDAPHDATDVVLDEVARVHGAPGPWAVLGYRMSQHALAKLGLQRGALELEVVHRTPREVRYSCIADGAAAHSGASLGKLNLSLVEASEHDVLTIYRDKRSGRSVALRPTAFFRERYADTPRHEARVLGREVLGRPAEQVFEEVPVP